MITRNEQEENCVAKKLHNESIVIDACIPQIDPNHFQTMIDASLTAAMVTISSVLDDCKQTLERISIWYDSFKRYRKEVILATTTSNIIKARDEDKVAIIMAWQDTKPIGSNLNLLDVFYRLGVKVMQLTYQHRNYIGNGCGESTDCGLSKYGRAVIERMNDLGILIDLSHCGYETTMEAIEKSSQPVAFTHALPRALSIQKIPRNKTDEQIKALANKGGVIGIHTWSKLGEREKGVRPTLNDFLDYIEYIIDLVGVEHVGIGTDFCPAWTATSNKRKHFEEAKKRFPELYEGYTIETKNFRDLENIPKLPNVTRGLVERGYSKRNIQKIIGLNWLNLLDQVWK